MNVLRQEISQNSQENMCARVSFLISCSLQAYDQYCYIKEYLVYQRISRVIFKSCFSRSRSPIRATKQTYFGSFTCRQTHSGRLKPSGKFQITALCIINANVAISYSIAFIFAFFQQPIIHIIIAFSGNGQAMPENMGHQFYVPI